MKCVPEDNNVFLLAKNVVSSFFTLNPQSNVEKMRVENLRKIAVLGAGVMGHGIAQLLAYRGIEVELIDRNS